jgi:hypothetical protein
LIRKTAISKNILIFSDGSGQAGGLRPDENRSNIYKLYRATRCGPDTDIDPRDQLAFYDAGPRLATFPVARSSRRVPIAGCTTSPARPRALASPRILSTVTWPSSGCGNPATGYSCRVQPRRVYRAVSRRRARPVRRPHAHAGRIASAARYRHHNAHSREAVKKNYQYVTSPRDTAFLRIASMSE